MTTIDASDGMLGIKRADPSLRLHSTSISSLVYSTTYLRRRTPLFYGYTTDTLIFYLNDCNDLDDQKRLLGRRLSMTSRRTSQQPTHRHPSHNQSTNAHASSSHSTDIPNRSTSRTPRASSPYNPVEDPHAFDTVGGTNWRLPPPQTYAPFFMPATSSNNPSNMFVDNGRYPSAQGTSSGRMPEISAPTPQSLAHAPRWPAVSSSSSSWNLQLPGPSPQRPPLPSRHATPRPHAPPPPPAVPSLPYPQVSQAGASGPSSLQPAGPSTSNLRAKATLKPRKSAKDSKKGPSSGYMQKYRLNPIPRIMSSLKTKSGSVFTSGAYRDADDIESDDDGMDHDGMDDGGSMRNVEPSAKGMRREMDRQRGTRHRGQIRGLIRQLHQLFWPDVPLPDVNDKKGLPHTEAQCLERAIEWVGDSVRNAVWQAKEAQFQAAIRERDEIGDMLRTQVNILAAENAAFKLEIAQLRESVAMLRSYLKR